MTKTARISLPSSILNVIGLSQKVQLGSTVLTLLEEIEFHIAAGEQVAIVGASGSGKSTLLGLLAGLDLPTAGRIELFGRDIVGLDEDQRAAVRAAGIGFVFQNFQLLPALSALENVMLPLELARRRDARERATHWLERVGLGQRLQHSARQLSGGEQQRVALARAFANEPQLIFADEPTGSLDTHTGELISDLLFEMNQEHQTTLVLVTHDARLAARCQRQLRLTAGRLSEGSV